MINLERESLVRQSRFEVLGRAKKVNYDCQVSLDDIQWLLAQSLVVAPIMEIQTSSVSSAQTIVSGARLNCSHQAELYLRLPVDVVESTMNLSCQEKLRYCSNLQS